MVLATKGGIFFPVKRSKGVRIPYLIGDVSFSCEDREKIELTANPRAQQGNQEGQCLEHCDSNKHICSRSQERTA